MFKRILFAYDSSDHSKRAAKITGDLGREMKSAEIWIVCVMEPAPNNLKEPYKQEFINAQKKAGKNFFDEARQLIGEVDKVHNELLFGDPAENILDLAKEKKCDLIIMGVRGLSVLEGLLMGSQVHKVLSHSTCPVLAVK